MAVVKVRGSEHSKDIRTFDITEKGIVMGGRLDGYEGLLTGSPKSAPNASPGTEEPKRATRRGPRPARR
jgi:hypothetical protein